MKRNLGPIWLSIILILGFIDFTFEREIKRVVKKVYLHRSYYYGKKFRKLISKQFYNFNHSYVMLFKEICRCIRENKEDPPVAEKSCLGANFRKVRQR